MTETCAGQMQSSLGRQLVRYATVGIGNTALGYAAILGLYATGASLIVANLGGYAVGLGLSYVGNRVWTFGQSRSPSCELAGFLALVGASLLLKITVVHLLLVGDLPFPAAQAVGVFAYSTTMFLGLRHVVFAPRR